MRDFICGGKTGPESTVVDMYTCCLASRHRVVTVVNIIRVSDAYRIEVKLTYLLCCCKPSTWHNCVSY